MLKKKAVKWQTTTFLCQWLKRLDMIREEIRCLSGIKRATKFLCRIRTACLFLGKQEKDSLPLHISRK